jgi:hypothetical protein
MRIANSSYTNARSLLEAKRAWGGRPRPRGSPWTRSWGFIYFTSRPTWASAADHGVRPTLRSETKDFRRRRSDDAEKIFRGAWPRTTCSTTMSRP